MLLQYYNLRGDHESRDESSRDAAKLVTIPEDTARLRELMSSLKMTQ
jgi:hypothetical protein